MKEIVVISGKGGAGKTSITASLAKIAGASAVLADCDVDAADMHLLTEPQILSSEDFYSSYVAIINQESCIKCGDCEEICRFDAISVVSGEYRVDPLECEGCFYCARICPTKAIEMKQVKDGESYVSKTRFGSYMAHAKLGIGAENSGKLVAKVKAEAKRIAQENDLDLILIDGAPGVGCPVISSLSGANYVVLVAEPTVSGVHDLKRVYEISLRFGAKVGCVINKYDLNLEKTEEIENFLKENDIELLAKTPYDETFTKAITGGKTVVEADGGKFKKVLEDVWEKIKTSVES